MSRFLARRFAHGAVVILGVTLVTFLLVHLLPGGPAQALLGARATPENVKALNKDLGLDKPLPAQYVRWIGRLGRGDLGESYQQHVPVSTLITANLPRTVLLLGLATFVSLLIAVPLAVYQAARRRTVGEYVATTITLFGYSMPVFWFGLILIIIFGINLHWLPTGGVVDPGQSESDILARLEHLVLPVAMLSITFVASWSRYIRSSMLDVLVQDFLRTAKAKGASRGRVLFRHALPNALVTTIVLIGASLPLMLSGALVTEVVFNYPGMGLLFWNAAQTRDFPILMGVVVILGVATVVGNLTADVLHAVAEPRIRRGMVAAS